MICVVAAFGASPFLPPLLRFDNGSRVATAEAWLTRRPQVSALAQDILLGRVPSTVPALVGARTINTTRTFLDLAAAGFVVIAYDQIGFGIRLAEGGAAFYRRYPRGASLLGKMVTDVSALVDALYCFGPRGRADGGRCFWAGSYSGSARAAAAVPALDDRKVLVAGYALGGTVALYAGALDARVTGVASVAGFTPMRTDSADRGTGGLARLASMHALAPRLGLYVGDEASVPFDYGDLLAAIAPRPTLLYTPKRDRDATFADVALCVDEVRPAWVSAGALRNPRPDDYSRLSPEAAAAVVEWAKAAVT